MDDDDTGSGASLERGRGRSEPARPAPLPGGDAASDDGGGGETLPPPLAGEGLEARGERRLARLLAPAGRATRHMRSFGRWIVLGALIGVAAGVGAIVFYAAIDLCTRLFQGGIAGYMPPGPAGEGRTIVTPATRYWLFPLSTTLGGLVAGALVTRLAPAAEGHGTDAAIATFHEGAGEMDPRIPIVKLVASAITLDSGGSAGREGPTAQISAGFGSLLGRVLRLDVRDRRIAVATGIGAGIGAIFRAPLGGAVLSAELLYRSDVEPDVLAPALVASIVGYTLFAAVFGWTPVFGNQPGLTFNHPLQLLYYAVRGLAVGLVGILYIRVFYGLQGFFARLRLSPYLKPALGGLLVGLIGLVVPQAVGVGYGWVQFLMWPDQTAVPLLVILLLPFLKILTTSLSIGSGGSGGIFGPGLVVGAGVGAGLWGLGHTLLPGMPATPAPFVVVAMMSLFGAVAHAPLAMMLMVGEMTGSYGLLAPAMVTVSIASVVVGDRTIYTSQPATRADSPAHRLSMSFPLLRALRVRDTMAKPRLVLAPDTPLHETRARMEAAGLVEAVVVEADNTLVGLITSRSLARAAGEQGATAGTAAVPTLSIESDETLDTALGLLAHHGVHRLPVVDSDTPLCPAGMLSTADIARAYAAHSGGEARRLGLLTPGTTLRAVTIADGERAAGRAVSDLGLPPHTLIVSIERNGATLIPQGGTVLVAGDALTVLTMPESAAQVDVALRG